MLIDRECTTFFANKFMDWTRRSNFMPLAGLLCTATCSHKTSTRPSRLVTGPTMLLTDIPVLQCSNLIESYSVHDYLTQVVSSFQSVEETFKVTVKVKQTFSGSWVVHSNYWGSTAGILFLDQSVFILFTWTSWKSLPPPHEYVDDTYLSVEGLWCG